MIFPVANMVISVDLVILNMVLEEYGVNIEIR